MYGVAVIVFNPNRGPFRQSQYVTVVPTVVSPHVVNGNILSILKAALPLKSITTDNVADPIITRKFNFVIDGIPRAVISSIILSDRVATLVLVTVSYTSILKIFKPPPTGGLGLNGERVGGLMIGVGSSGDGLGGIGARTGEIIEP